MASEDSWLTADTPLSALRLVTPRGPIPPRMPGDWDWLEYLWPEEGLSEDSGLKAARGAGGGSAPGCGTCRLAQSPWGGGPPTC